MKSYECIICNFKSPLKSNYNRHNKSYKHLRNIETEKKNNISLELAEVSQELVEENSELANKSLDTVSDISLNIKMDDKKIENEYLYNNLTCKYCMKEFKHKSSLSKHIKYTCKKNEDEDLKELVRLLNLQLKQNDEMYKKQIDNQQRQIDKLTEKLKVNQPIHLINNDNRQINFIRLSHKDTYLDHLTLSDYTNIIRTTNMCVKNMIEKVHFDTLHPENMNIYISNLKDKYIMIYTGESWELKMKEQSIEELYNDNEMRIEEWLNKYGNNELKEKFEKYLSNKENPDVISMINEEVRLLLYNKRHLIENEVDK